MLWIGSVLLLSMKPNSGFVAIPGGRFQVGNEILLENHRRTVSLEGFEIAKFDTTNREFGEFVRATGYVTDAERFHNALVFRPGHPEFTWVQDPTAHGDFRMEKV